jgi:hypothetical protein
MAVVIPIIVTILGLGAVVGTVIFNVYLSNKEQKLTARPNMPFIEIHSQLRKSIIGYSRGVVESQTPRPNGTVLLKIYPDDVVQGENVKRPDVKYLVVHKDYIKRFAEGEMYPKRQAIIILPKNGMDLPIGLLNTDFGKILEKEGQLAYLKQVMGATWQPTHQAIKEAMEEYAMGEVSKSDLRRLKNLNEREKTTGTQEVKTEDKK